MPDAKTQTSATKTAAPVKHISENDAKKLQKLINTSTIPEEDKKWWLERIKGLNARQAKQLWRILHAKDAKEFDAIIKEEEQYQVNLKEDAMGLQNDAPF